MKEAITYYQMVIKKLCPNLSKKEYEAKKQNASNDFDEIINLISSVHYIIISYKGEVLKEPQFDSIENQEFNIYSRNICQDNSSDFNQESYYDHIAVTQQRVVGGMLQPMSVILVSRQQDDAKKNEVISLYNCIKKHIKKNYVISSDKMFYMGPQAYLDWEKRHFKTAYLFLEEKVLIRKRRRMVSLKRNE